MFSNGSPILPIGKVNLTDGKNAMFGTVWNCWSANAEYTNILVKEGDKQRVVHSSGSVKEKAGDAMRLRHDQTGAAIGGNWTVVGTYPHTEDGLRQIAAASGKKSLSFATFK
jgi:hypothetical protein